MSSATYAAIGGFIRFLKKEGIEPTEALVIQFMKLPFFEQIVHDHMIRVEAKKE